MTECHKHRYGPVPLENGKCPACVVETWRSDLLRRLSREVAPSVPYAPTTFAGFDRVACRCGPASDLEPGYDTEHGGLHCCVCDKPAPGAVQLAWHHAHAAEHPYDANGWHGLGECHFCREPARVLHPSRNEYGCLSCGERIDRQLMKVREIQAKTKADEAAEKALAVMWRQRLCDMSAPSPAPQHAGRFAAAIDKAAAVLAEAAVQPKEGNR